MTIGLTTILTGDVQDLDKNAKERVEAIQGARMRKDDEMEVARTSIEKGVIFLDAYLGSLTKSGLNLKKYSANINQEQNGGGIIYKLILKKI